jgi:hypothetical protein
MAPQASMAPREWARRVGRTGERAGRRARRRPAMAGTEEGGGGAGEGVARFI